MDPDQTIIKKRYFSNRQKQEILEELDSGILTHSDLAKNMVYIP
ncbi:MAG: hypothetical protein AB8C84_01385 [Oligoflexales bacterium]